MNCINIFTVEVISSKTTALYLSLYKIYVLAKGVGCAGYWYRTGFVVMKTKLAAQSMRFPIAHLSICLSRMSVNSFCNKQTNKQRPERTIQHLKKAKNRGPKNQNSAEE